MNLEQKLSNSAEPWLAEEVLSPAQSAALATLVRRKFRTRRLVRGVRAAVIAAALVSVVMCWPVLVSLASDSPMIGPLIVRWGGLDRGAYWAAQNGYVVPIGKVATDQGYSFQVESVLADAARTVVYYVVDGPNLTGDLPIIDATYNLRSPSGASGSEGTLIDGRLYGTETLPPLPHPVSLVNLTVGEIAGVKGTWKVSFMASRAELDAMTRSFRIQEPPEPLPADATEHKLPNPAATVEVPKQPSAAAEPEPPVSVPAVEASDQPLSEPVVALLPDTGQSEQSVDLTKKVYVDDIWRERCGLTITRIVLTPTETVVEMVGPAAGHCDIRKSELEADGQLLTATGSSWSLGLYKIRFDRLEGDPAQVTLRLTTVVKWEEGGPVIDLSQPGVRTTYGELWFELESITHEDGNTVIHLNTGPEGTDSEAFFAFRRWVVTDTDGNLHSVTRGHAQWVGTPAVWHEERTIDGDVPSLLTIQSQLHAVPVPGPFEVTIPLK
ncbi:MAG TPA: DUF4179 domain-containing protein [Symbiobacteriaceae bacterium]|nr:DUF4179 domain-containing protein [Symbiobacteriaceae bacterium]